MFSCLKPVLSVYLPAIHEKNKYSIQNMRTVQADLKSYIYSVIKYSKPIRIPSPKTFSSNTRTPMRHGRLSCKSNAFKKDGMNFGISLFVATYKQTCTIAWANAVESPNKRLFKREGLWEKINLSSMEALNSRKGRIYYIPGYLLEGLKGNLVLTPKVKDGDRVHICMSFWSALE